MKNRILNFILLLLYFSSGLIIRQLPGVEMSIWLAVFIPILVPMILFAIGIGMILGWVFMLFLIEMIFGQD